MPMRWETLGGRGGSGGNGLVSKEVEELVTWLDWGHRKICMWLGDGNKHSAMRVMPATGKFRIIKNKKACNIMKKGKKKAKYLW